MVVSSVLRFGFLTAVFGLMAAAQAPPEPAAPPPPPMPPVLQNYTPITAERLTKPEDGDWVMIRRTYDGWGYSPLTQITPPTCSGCSRSGSFRTGMASGHEAAPDREQRRDVRRDAGQPGDRASMPRPATSFGAIEAAAARRRHHSCTPPAAAWRCTATRCISPPARRRSWRSTRRPARRSGPRQVADNKSRLLHVARAAGGRRQSHGRRVRRRAGHPRLRRSLRSRNRRGSCGGPTPCRRPASLAARLGPQGRAVEDRRRLDLGHRQLRSGDQSGVLGHRQRRAVDGRSASRRQSVHLLDHRASTSRPARSRATISTIPNESWDWDEVSPPHSRRLPARTAEPSKA